MAALVAALLFPPRTIRQVPFSSGPPVGPASPLFGGSAAVLRGYLVSSAVTIRGSLVSPTAAAAAAVVSPAAAAAAAVVSPAAAAAAAVVKCSLVSPATLAFRAPVPWHALPPSPSGLRFPGTLLPSGPSGLWFPGTPLASGPSGLWFPGTPLWSSPLLPPLLPAPPPRLAPRGGYGVEGGFTSPNSPLCSSYLLGCVTLGGLGSWGLTRLTVRSCRGRISITLLRPLLPALGTSISKGGPN
jgi:hypothetical protein